MVLISVASVKWEGKTPTPFETGSGEGMHLPGHLPTQPFLRDEQVPAAIGLHQVCQAQRWHIQPQKLHDLHVGAGKHIQICVQ